VIRITIRSTLFIPRNLSSSSRSRSVIALIVIVSFFTILRARQVTVSLCHTGDVERTREDLHLKVEARSTAENSRGYLEYDACLSHTCNGHTQTSFSESNLRATRSGVAAVLAAGSKNARLRAQPLCLSRRAATRRWGGEATRNHKGLRGSVSGPWRTCDELHPLSWPLNPRAIRFVRECPLALIRVRPSVRSFARSSPTLRIVSYGRTSPRLVRRVQVRSARFLCSSGGVPSEGAGR